MDKKIKQKLPSEKFKLQTEQIDWLAPKQATNFLTEEERHLISMRDSKVCWKLIARELNCCRTAAWSRWQRALSKLLFSR